MTATQVIPASPFGVLKGDTYPVPSVRLTDINGDPVDPAGWTISLERWTEMGEESSMPSTEADGVITFPWLVDDTLAGTKWETMIRVLDGTNEYSLYAPVLYVHDTATLLCTVNDVVAIVGEGYSQYDILRAIEQASAAVTAWATLPISGPPVPLAVRRATALLAARAVTTVPGSPTTGDTAISSEKIGDYEIRYFADDLGTGGAEITDEIADLLLPWRPKVYSSIIGEFRAPDPTVTDDADNEGYLPL